MFRDECEVDIAAGKGGDGLMSFLRDKQTIKGGPNGGDGGDGGDVIFIASPHLNSLLALGRRYHYRADCGQPGMAHNCAGPRGKDLEIELPVGTQVFDRTRGNLLRDLSQPGMRFVVAQGGRGGRGNTHFANAVRQTPRFAEPGRLGEQRALRLELKLMADVGLVGLPNAGKSTLLARVSAARPKIADYPFTTLSPNVGIAQIAELQTLCIADLPGLIEGASEGHGLGLRFLKHVERCGLLLHLVDVSPGTEVSPEEAARVIEQELSHYSAELALRDRIVVATKCESVEALQRAAELEHSLGRPVWRISAHSGEGVQELLRECYRRVQLQRRATQQASA